MAEPLSLIATAERRLRYVYDELRSASRAAGLELTGPQALLLAGFTEGTSAREIMDNAYFGTNATYNIGVLRREGLIKAEASQRDRRKIAVRRTGRGRAIGNAVAARLAELFVGVDTKNDLQAAG